MINPAFCFIFTGKHQTTIFMPNVLFAGLSTIDIQFFVDQFPGSNEKVKCKVPDILVGGPALNAAVAYSFLNKGAYLLSAVGKNPFKSLIQEDLQQHGVQLIDLITEKEINPVLASVITSSNGDRSILSHHPEDHAVGIDIRNLFEQLKPELVMVDGFYPKMTTAVCEEAKNREIPIVFDGGSWKPHLEQIIPYLDFIICSADFCPPGCLTKDDVLHYFEQQQKKYVAISRGSDSILCSSQQEITIEKMKIKDSLGAGDFLHGAFCFYWLKSRDFRLSLQQASKFASATCKYEGTRKCFGEQFI